MLRTPKPEELKLNNEINAVLDCMSTYGPDSPEYPTFLNHLNNLRELQKAYRAPWKPSGDQLAQVIGTFAGVVTIVSYEHLHVITSKAMTLLRSAK